MAKATTEVKLKEAKLITCIVPKETGPTLLKALKEKKNLRSAHVNHSRGAGMSTPVGFHGKGQQIEKDIVNVIVSRSKADEIFEFIHDEMDINRPHGGFIYMTKLVGTVPFSLPPDLPEEEDS